MDILQIIAALEQRATFVGLSMAEVCRRAKVGQSSITRWKAGTFEPRLATLKKLDAIIADEERGQAAARKAPQLDRVLAAQV